MTPLTRAAIEELKALAEKATAGGWDVLPSLISTGSRPFVGVNSGNGLIAICQTHNGAQDREQRDKNAAFIAAAREAIPALIAKIEEMDAALKPFATDAKRALSSVPDDDKLRVVYAAYAPNGCIGEISAGDLRRALAARLE